MKTVKISKEFAKMMEEHSIEKKEIMSTVQKWIRNFVPVNVISDAMINTTQVVFNIKENGIELIDPFNITKLEKRFFEV